MRRKKKPSPKSTATGKPGPPKADILSARLPKADILSARLIEGKVPYLIVSLNEPVTEKSVVEVFEGVRREILRHEARRVLVDGRQSPVTLSISDLHGLAKLVGALSGTLTHLALVMRPQDILPEKFFEPAVTHRGLPTLVTAEFDEAVYWLTTRLRPQR